MTHISWTRLGLALILLTSTLLCLDPQMAPNAQSIPDPRFGVVEAYAAPSEATALGAGWTRVTFEWNKIQPRSPNEWNVTPISDEALTNELNRGRQVVGLLVTTPGWATDTDIGPGVPQGLYLPTDDPNNLWAKFVRSIVERYAGRIDHWIIWNEPEIRVEEDATWGGSVEDFVQLLRVAYLAAKETNPNAVIHTASLSHWHDEHWFGQFLDTLASDPDARANDYYFDVAGLNLYLEPEKIYDVIAHYYDEMHNRGIYKPIWITETNAYLSRVSLEEQAYFIFQAFSLEIAANAQRIAVYKMADVESDQAADPEPFGLIQMDGSRRPAFTAYRAAATYLAGFQGGNWDRRESVSIVTIDRGQRTTTVVWARKPEPQTVMIAARTTRALLVDVWGGARYTHPERGYYYIDLPGANCNEGCTLGGLPFMLVEEAPPDASTAPTPAPPTPNTAGGAETTPVQTLSPTATLTPTPTRSPTSTPKPTNTPSPTPVPLPSSDIPPGRPWLLVGMLALALGGTAITAGRRRIV